MGPDRLGRRTVRPSSLTIWEWGAELRPVDFTKVTFEDSFWAPRMETNRNSTLRAMHKQMLDTGRIAGIDPNYRPGDRDAHKILWDSDAGKWIEAAAYTLATDPDPEVEAWVDEMVDLFEKGQQPDGYVNSFYTSVEPEKQWKNLRDNHELYNNGHLIEGAVAYYQATGKRKLLDIVCKCADNIDSKFGPEEGKQRGYPGHEEIEIALVKLYKATGNQRYLKLASYFLDERGRQPHYGQKGRGP